MFFLAENTSYAHQLGLKVKLDLISLLPTKK